MSRFLLLLALAGAAVEPAFAQAPPPAGQRASKGDKVHIQMLVVHATDSAEGVDSRLQALSSSFKYFKYKGYRLLDTEQADVAAQGSASFSVDGDHKVKVTLLGRDEARARVRVEVSGKEGKLLDTTVGINRDGTFIVAGPKFKDGILMLPLTASY